MDPAQSNPARPFPFLDAETFRAKTGLTDAFDSLDDLLLAARVSGLAAKNAETGFFLLALPRRERIPLDLSWKIARSFRKIEKELGKIAGAVDQARARHPRK